MNKRRYRLKRLDLDDTKYRLTQSQLKSVYWVGLLCLLLTLACTSNRTFVSSEGRATPTRTPLPTFTPTSIALALPPSSATPAASQSLDAPAVGVETAPNTTSLPSQPVTTSSPGDAPSPRSTLPPLSNKATAPPATLPPLAEAPAATLPPLSVSPQQPASPTPLSENNQPIPATSLPNNTPSTEPTTPADFSTPTPTPTTDHAATPPPLPTPTATIPFNTANWSFVNVGLSDEQFEGGIVLYGEAINESGASQEIDLITGTFFDKDGQPVADETNTFDDWPTSLVPPGGRLPFTLIVDDVDSIAAFDLTVTAVASQERPRDNFEFVDLRPREEGGDYCLTGQVRNPGEPLGIYLLITAVLYDSQERVINFGSYDVETPEAMVSVFDICIEPPNQGVDRYALMGWGE